MGLENARSLHNYRPAAGSQNYYYAPPLSCRAMPTRVVLLAIEHRGSTVGLDAAQWREVDRVIQVECVTKASRGFSVKIVIATGRHEHHHFCRLINIELDRRDVRLIKAHRLTVFVVNCQKAHSEHPIVEGWRQALQRAAQS